MATPIMPQGTAIWLIENTALTFNQISKFCNLHELEVQALADEQVAAGMVGVDPITMNQLTAAEISKCEANPDLELCMKISNLPEIKKKGSKRKYMPLIKRQERPNAIAWILKYHPDMSDQKICSLLSTTKTTVLSLRNKTHAKMHDLKPKDPVLLGFCSQIELDSAVNELKAEQAKEEQV